MRKLLLLIFLALPVFAQTSVTHGAGAPPSSTCSLPSHVGRTYANTTPNPPVPYLCGTTGWGISGGSGGGATIPNTTNLINGDGAGNGADSGLVVNTVATLAGVQTLTNKTIDGVSPTTMGFVDPTSSIQTQLNGKAASNASTTVNSQSCALGSTCTIPLVASFNTRTGAVTLSSGDVTTALGYTPLSTTILVTGAQGGTGVNNGASTITVGGNVTYTGAFTFAGTVTGNTAVTFPTSGTLLGTSAAVTVGQGGTGLATGTSGGVLGFTGSTTIASSIAGVTGAMMAWGGAAATPTSPLSLLVTNQNSATETWTLYNSTATTGVTSLIIRQGATVTSNAMTTFAITDNAGTKQVGYDNISGTSYWHVAGTTSELWGGNPGSIINSIFVVRAPLNVMSIASTTGLGWCNGVTAAGCTVDVMFDRDATGIMGVTNGTQGTTLANYRDFKFRHTLCSGTAPTLTSGGGGTPGAPAGGDCDGRVTLGSSPGNTVVITFGTAYSNAPGGCKGTDETNQTTIVVECVASASTITLYGYSRTTGIAASFTSSDVLSWAVPHGY